MSHQSRTVELKKKLQLYFPINIQLPDPITGVDFTVTRANVMTMLLIDTGNITVDAESVAALYAEMARCQRACERAADKAGIAYRQWRSEESKTYRASVNTKLTEKAVEEHYRSHKDYADHSDLPDYYKRLASLFADLKDAFRLKGDVIKSQRWTERGRESTERAGEESATVPVGEDSLDRITEMAREVLEKGRADRDRQMAPHWNGGGAEESAPPAPTPTITQSDPAPVDDDDDDDDSVPPPPPPAPIASTGTPRKKRAKKAAGKKAPAKKKRRKRRAAPAAPTE